jgi:hypothetical protein
VFPLILFRYALSFDEALKDAATAKPEERWENARSDETQ